MAEYIKREALIGDLTAAMDHRGMGQVIGQTLIRYVKRQPAADVAPVVRCKDCKFHEDEEIGMVYCPNTIGGWIEEDWFCADGERKDGTDSDTDGSI